MKSLTKNKRVAIICICLLFAAAMISCKKSGDNADETKDVSNTAAPTSAVQDETPTATPVPTQAPVVAKNFMEDYKSTGTLPSLADLYKDQFYIGVALSNMDINVKNKADLVAGQFNSLTCENEMKPDFILDKNASIKNGDEECPAINFNNAKTALNFAQANGIKMRFHTLVWHAQTPRWFFTVGYSDKPDAPFVTREVMLKRMDNYIRQVMEYLNTNYPGVVYAFDVVNEAIEPGDGRQDGIRVKNNNWYDVVGPDYVEMAFTFARKYVGPDQKLFYNDYGTEDKNKMFYIRNLVTSLKEKNVIIDGIGMQDHVSMTSPSLLDYQYAINKYAELGLEIEVTELDVYTTDNSEEGLMKQASRLRGLLTILQNCQNKGTAKVSSVTFWGLTDDRSWLNKPDTPCYPLLFNKDLTPKPAYFGVAMDDSIKLY